MATPRRPTTRAAAFVREGTTLQDRLARLGHAAEGHTAVLSFQPDGDAPVDPPMIVLPNLELEAMEREQSTAGGGPAVFRVSGVVTEYKGRNYVRIDRAAADGDERAVAHSAAGPRVDRTSGRAAVAPAAPVVRLVRDGTHVVNRMGRLNLSADGRTATLTFDSDGRAMRDPPMVVLPNLKAANMEGQRAGLFKDVKFRVSGTVSEYGGRNYILLDKAVASQDFDVDF